MMHDPDALLGLSQRIRADAAAERTAWACPEKRIEESPDCKAASEVMRRTRHDIVVLSAKFNDFMSWFERGREIHSWSVDPMREVSFWHICEAIGQDPREMHAKLFAGMDDALAKAIRAATGYRCPLCGDLK